jgi:hypothetical protein
MSYNSQILERDTTMRPSIHDKEENGRIIHRYSQNKEFTISRHLIFLKMLNRYWRIDHRRTLVLEPGLNIII